MRQSTGFADYDAESYVPHWAIPPPQLWRSGGGGQGSFVDLSFFS